MSFLAHSRLYVWSGFLLLIDQYLKYLIRLRPAPRYLIDPWLGFEYYTNPGIAFSLPFPNLFLVIITPLILLWLVKLLTTERRASRTLAILLIAAGALSNFIDRLVFGVTIDYLRVLTGVINLADIMIAVGIVLLYVYRDPNGRRARA